MSRSELKCGKEDRTSQKTTSISGEARSGNARNKALLVEAERKLPENRQNLHGGQMLATYL